MNQTCEVQYPTRIINQAKARSPKPTFVQAEPFETGQCRNCGDRGFLAAFFAHYEKSAIAETVPPLPAWEKGVNAGKCIKWVNKGWWIGSHETFPCPVCNV